MDYYESGRNIHSQQLSKIVTNFIEEKLNKGNNTFDQDHRRSSSSNKSKKGYEINYTKP